MLIGFDTEFGFRTVRRVGGRLEPDVTTAVPVCAALAFEDGRTEVFAGDYGRLAIVLANPRYTFAVHGAHAEMQFCRAAGIPFPARCLDTLVRGVLLAHATTFDPVGGAYRQAGLATLAPKFDIPFVGTDDKDAIRDSILTLRHEDEYGMDAIKAYCLADAVACLRLVRPLSDALAATAGPNAERNARELYQPYAAVTAGVAARGIRFDLDGWDRLLSVADRYRRRQLDELRRYGYDHDGDGLGVLIFERMLAGLGLDRVWPRTPTGRLRTREQDLKEYRNLHPAVAAVYRLVRFHRFLAQRLGDRVDRDGRVRCGILPLAQRSSRTSTVRPNLTGIPGELRPLLLPDEGCRLVHFDFGQQEPGIAAHLSGDRALLDDFAAGDVYESLGRRMGVITPGMPPDRVKHLRGKLLKGLMLSILYGRSAVGIARDLGCHRGDAEVHLARFEQTYPRLFAWMREYVCGSMARGWAENVIGFRAAFDVREPTARPHVARSCQNFVVQSSAAVCFQLTGLHLADFGADVRLGLHDGYVLNVPDDPRSLAEAKLQVEAATEAASAQLFPGLPVKREIETLGRFAKDGREDSLDDLLASLAPEESA